MTKRKSTKGQTTNYKTRWILKKTQKTSWRLLDLSTFVTALNFIFLPCIPPFYIHNWNLDFKNWFSIASQRRTENNGTLSVYCYIEKSHLSNVIQNLIININNKIIKILEFVIDKKYLKIPKGHICPVWRASVSTRRSIFQWILIMLHYSRWFVSTHL